MYESEHPYSPQPTPTKGRAVEIAPCRTSTTKLHMKIPEAEKKKTVQLPRHMERLLHKALLPVPHPVQLQFSQMAGPLTLFPTASSWRN